MTITILELNDYTVEDFAVQLTAYEKWGFIDYEDAIKDLIIHDYLEEAEINELVYKWSEFCQSNSAYYDDEFYYNDDDFFNNYFAGSEPTRIIQATYFGDYRYMDDWVQFNGYGNLDSFSDWQVKEGILSCNDFIQWLYENEDEFEELRDEEIKEFLINEALKLVKEGY